MTNTTGFGLKVISTAAHIFREYDAGRMNDFTAQFLLRRLPQVADAFEHTGNGRVDGEPTRATYEMACRLVLEDHEMAHDYKGYGAYMSPVDKAEATRLFERGEAVYNIYDGDAEGELKDAADLERFGFFAVDARNMNPYRDITAFEESAVNSELSRRLNKIGYTFENARGEACICCGDKRIAHIEGDELVFSLDAVDVIEGQAAGAGFRADINVGELYNVLREVSEYMPAYLRSLTKDDRLNAGYNRLFEHNGYVMGMAPIQPRREQPPDGQMMYAASHEHGFHFVTWQVNHDGDGYNCGHYYNNYTAAKEDFAVRAGMTRSDRMLTETELAVARSAMSDYLELDGGENVDFRRENDIRGVIEKIDSVIEPQAEEQARTEGAENEAGDDEPE